jgi:Tat protein translocase TatB subunit
LDIVKILVVLAIALVVIGPERLPEVLRTVGKILRELRAASNEVMRELTDALEDEPRRPQQRPEDEPHKDGEPTAPPGHN